MLVKQNEDQSAVSFLNYNHNAQSVAKKLPLALQVLLDYVDVIYLGLFQMPW